MVVSEMFLSYNAARFGKVALYQRFFSLTYQVLFKLKLHVKISVPVSFICQQANEYYRSSSKS